MSDEKPTHRDVSAAFELPDRLADLGCGLAALIPRGVIDPPALPPLADLGTLPALRVIPERITTPPILAELGDREASPAARAVDAVLAKVRAEHERMQRLLPEAPAGMYWEAELQTGEPSYAFERNSADMLARLVYRLRRIDGE